MRGAPGRTADLAVIGFALAILLAAAGLAWRPAPPAAPIAPPSGWAAPAPGDRGARCADVGPVRACWGEALAGPGCAPQGAGSVCVAERPVPARPAPPAGWRCSGDGRDRTCLDRRLGAGPFECARDTCTQRHPRLPDEATWECVELEGVVVCRGGAPSSGVTPAAPDPGWICGWRRGHHAVPICVDLAPDLPPREAGPGDWRCRYDHARGVRRICRRSPAPPSDPAPPAIGRACRPRAPACPPGSTCADGRCLPLRPAAECWLHEDCGAGRRCRLATCVEEAAR